MASCAFRDCGRAECEVCYWGRQPVQSGRSASTADPMREDAKAEFAAKKKDAVTFDADGRLVAAPKRKHRVGPHR